MIEKELTPVATEKSAYQLIRPQDITSFSKVLKEFITKSKLSTKIQGKEYVNVDGWKFAGLNFGLVPIVHEPVPIQADGQVITILYHEIEKRWDGGKKLVIEPFFSSSNQELSERYRVKFKDKIKKEITHDFYRYRCGCEIINHVTQTKMGAGYGLCSNLELSKTSFDEFAVMSFAQTRAIGRGFKNMLGFIMESAGYAPTPTEEMDGGQKQVNLDENTFIDIKAALQGCTTVQEITKLWNELDSVAQNQTKGLFTRRKTEVQKK